MIFSHFLPASLLKKIQSTDQTCLFANINEVDIWIQQKKKKKKLLNQINENYLELLMVK